MSRLFGTDGVRGVANQDLSPELAFQLGYAGAKVLAKQLVHKPRFVLGRDTRLSGSLMEQALCAGLCAAGADAYLAGIVPTPAIAYLTKEKGFDAGVMISASHNPFEFNGIKFFNSDGFKLSDALEDEIEAFLLAQADCPKGQLVADQRVQGADIGQLFHYPQGADHYLAHLRYAMGLDLTGFSLAMDCANGAAYELAPRLFRQLGAELHVMGNTPNGININDNCGSTHLKALQELVCEKGLSLGLAFDGDADRLLAVDAKGQVVSGDGLLAILSQYLRAKGKLRADSFVCTVMSNLGLQKFAKDQGFGLRQTKVGDRYVLEEMRAKELTLGGEQSGHLILLDYGTTGDGILSALALLKALHHSGQTLEEAAKALTIYPQVLKGVRVENNQKATVLASDDLQKQMNEIERALGDRGRLLVRASGTEPLIRVMLEGEHLEEIEQYAQQLVQTIEGLCRS